MALVGVLGVTDKTVFLAARSEHFWTALICLAVVNASGPWVAACQAVWLGIWVWAGISKMNHHFPSVIMVMINNGPFFPRFLKRRLFESYPDDLRPSGFAKAMARMGTTVELSIPVLLLVSPTSELLLASLCVMTVFHAWIALNNPSGMPIEWNIAMVYGGWVLFGHYPDANLAQLLGQPALMGFLLFFLVVIPTYGNLVPSKVPFLLAMRYYAGNWAYNIWLFRGDSAKKLDKLSKPSGTLQQQLQAFVKDEDERHKVLMMTPAHRLLHLEGRPLLQALPHAVDDIDEYDWMDGEVLGGVIIGWNFGDGHLNGRQLLDNVQRQCEFEEGELRVVSIEGQPLFGKNMHWSVLDAKTGLVEEGHCEVGPLRQWQPWPEGEPARAISPR